MFQGKSKVGSTLLLPMKFVKIKRTDKKKLILQEFTMMEMKSKVYVLYIRLECFAVAHFSEKPISKP